MATATTTPQTAQVVQPQAKPAQYYLDRVIRYALLIGIGLILLSPFILSFLGTFKTNREILAYPPTIIPTDAPVVVALREAATQILGRAPTLTVSGPANESYLLNGYGIPTCVFGPEGGGAHAADEYVDVDSIFAVAEVYATTARTLAQEGADAV